MYQESAYAFPRARNFTSSITAWVVTPTVAEVLARRSWTTIGSTAAKPGNIFTTIMQGRPNGMPSFRNRIPEYQVWEIAAYVRSMAGLLPKGVSPGTPDHMRVKPAESSTPPQMPNGITGFAGAASNDAALIFLLLSLRRRRSIRVAITFCILPRRRAATSNGFTGSSFGFCSVLYVLMIIAYTSSERKAQS